MSANKFPFSKSALNISVLFTPSTANSRKQHFQSFVFFWPGTKTPEKTYAKWDCFIRLYISKLRSRNNAYVNKEYISGTALFSRKPSRTNMTCMTIEIPIITCSTSPCPPFFFHASDLPTSPLSLPLSSWYFLAFLTSHLALVFPHPRSWALSILARPRVYNLRCATAWFTLTCPFASKYEALP